MSRSSIFSFESYAELRPRTPWTLLGVLGVIVAIECGLRALPEDFILPPFSRLGIFRWLEREVIPKFEHPRIVFMGTSRIADGIAPQLLNEDLGLPRGSTLNLGLQGGTNYDALQFYQRNRETLRRAKLLVINIDEWCFGSLSGAGYRYGLTAPWNERWHYSQETELLQNEGERDDIWRKRCEQHHDNVLQRRTQLLLDGTFQTRLLLGYFAKAVLLKLGVKTRTRILDENDQVRTARTEVGPEITDPAYFTERVHIFYRAYDFHPFMVGHLRRLIQQAQTDGLRVVLLQMPNRRIYQSEVDRFYRRQYDAQRKVLAQLAAEFRIEAYCYRYPEDCGLKERDFEDYGHLAFRGTRTFTAFIGELIRKNQLLAE